MDASAAQQQKRTLVVRLDPDTEARIARRVAVLLLRHLTQLRAPATSREPLTAAEVSKRYRVHRGWVYEHAAELGAIRIGSGPRPRLRFDAEQVARRLTPQSQNNTPKATAELAPQTASARAPR